MSEQRMEPEIKTGTKDSPDAIQLETSRPPIPLYLVWYLVFALLGAGILWASIAEIDKIVTADGRVVTDRPNITMKPLERTVIKTVQIRIGDRVKAGQVLFTFDQTENLANLGRLREQQRSYSANKDRLTSEAVGYQTPYVLPPNPTPDEYTQKVLYDARCLYYIEKLASYDESIRRYEKTLAELKASMDKYTGRQGRYQEIESMMKGLQKKNIVSLKDRLEIEAQVLALGIQTDKQQVSIVTNSAQLEVTRAERNAFMKDWQRKIMEELVTVDRNLLSINQEIPKAEMLCGYTELRSPCDAVVHELAPFQEGSAVREAEALVTLVPIHVEMLAEIDIPAKDRGLLSAGDECRIKFDAFPYQQCGTLNGKIRYISQDTFNTGVVTPEQAAETDAGGRQSQDAMSATYQARLTLSGSFRGRAAKAAILPGMRLKAELKVGKRTVLSYLLNPLRKAFDEAIREP